MEILLETINIQLESIHGLFVKMMKDLLILSVGLVNAI